MDQVVLISFCSTIFAYSYAYTWPIWAYTTVGLLAVLLEKNENSLGEEVVDKEEKKYRQGRDHVPAAV